MNTIFIMLLSTFISLQDAPFSWLCGNWILEGGKAQEVWICEGTNLRGYGLQSKEGSMQMSEQLEIVREGEGWYYIARVPGQNQDRPVRFRSVHVSADSLAFENPEHDFPKRIAYKKKDGDHMQVTISDMKEKKRIFNFTKH